MLNIGYMEVSSNGVIARVYYDTTFTPVGNDQPLINGPRNYCLDVSNVSGENRTVTVAGITATVAQGDPVTTGTARSRTATQMATLGYTTRGSIAMKME